MADIVLVDSFTADQDQLDVWNGLREHGSCAFHQRTSSDQLVERCAGAWAILTNKVVVDAAALAALPDVRYIGVLATGYNIVDVDAARQRGIAVTNIPGYGPESVAQTVFAHLLHQTHDIAGHARRVNAGDWSSCPDFCFFNQPLIELAGKTLVVVGLGAIGSAVKRIAEGFGMRVIAAQTPGRPASPDRMPLAEALSQADVISLHCPLTPDTEGLVDTAFLQQCKPGLRLINTGRGQLLDEAAVLAALQSGQLAAVGVDVLSAEPPPADHPLINVPGVTVSPHLAWGTVEARQRLIGIAIDNVAAFRADQAVNRVD